MSLAGVQFSLPAVELEKAEEAIWEDQRKGQLDAAQTVEAFAAARYGQEHKREKQGQEKGGREDKRAG